MAPDSSKTFATKLRENGYSGPCTYLMTLNNMAFAHQGYKSFSLHNAGGIGGCMCYIKSAESIGMTAYAGFKRDGSYGEMEPDRMVTSMLDATLNPDMEIRALDTPQLS